MRSQIKSFILCAVTAILVVIYVRSCESKPVIKEIFTTPKINTDSIAKSGYEQGYAIAKLEELGKIKETDTQVKVSSWENFKVKTDTIHDTLFRECVTTCEEAVNAECDYINYLEILSCKKDNLINTWKAAYRADTANFSQYRDSVKVVFKENKKLRRQNFWLKTANVAQAVLNGWQAARN